MSFVFSNPLVKLVYSPAVDLDRMIHTACYSGMLSNIHECAADRLFSRKSPLIKLNPSASKSTIGEITENSVYDSLKSTYTELL